MRLNFAFLCDYAMTSKEGKLSILGIFDRIFVRNLPAMHKQAYLAFQLELGYQEVGQSFEVQIQCIDADGGDVFGVQSEIKVEGPQRFGQTLRMNNVVRVNDMRFRKAGAHDINFFVDGKHQKAVNFTVEVRGEEEPPQIEASEPPSSPGE